MRELTSENFTAVQIKLIRKYLKLKIMEDDVTFRGHKQEWSHVYDLMKRAVLQGESHSALLIGPRGSGKTTLVNSVLHQLTKETDIASDAIIVRLNGHIHHDDKVALKSITAQMQLENAVGDRVFGTFAENLAFLLSCLQSGADRRCKSMLFLLEEFDMFCHSSRTQTLLYNLFDITHSRQAPMCVLGVTNRLDVMEMLEKRVKSRFSHRHIFIFADGETKPHDVFADLLLELLTMPLVKKRRGRKKSNVSDDATDTDTEDYSIPAEVLQRCKINPQTFTNLAPDFVEDWNAHIKALRHDDKVLDTLEKLCYYTINEQTFRDILFQVVCTISQNKPFIEATDLISTIDKAVCPEHKVKLLQSLSVLELSLVIAMRHGMEIFDGQPMNFEMVLHRYTKFATTNSSTQTVPRPVILKAFEHLQALEIIMPVRGSDSHTHDTTASRVQKEYQLFALTAGTELCEAVKTYKALPTEINHWFGVTNRLDVMEMLEKRVKSRFSHRHIFIFADGETKPHDVFADLLLELLTMPLVKKRRGRKKSNVSDDATDTDTEDYSIPAEVLQRCRINPQTFTNLAPDFVEDWNAHIKALRHDDKVLDTLEKLCYYTINEQTFRDILFQVVCTISQNKPFIEATDLISTIDKAVCPEHKVKLLQSLSVLELSLVIAMRHGMEIFDGQPMNFEMVLHRYTKFATTNSSTQTVPRPVILKAFEHLQALEIIMPVRGSDSHTHDTTASRVQKEYQLFALTAATELCEAVKTYKALPTEINHWFGSLDV